MSRDKAKTEKFIRLGTRPEEYTANHKKMISKSMHCELCGQLITYAFLLAHKQKSEKNLLVGSDCIISYVETYMPNVMASMIEKMKREMTDLIDENKALVFAEAYPEFINSTNRLRDFLGKNLPGDLRFGIRKFPLLEDIEKAKREYKAKKYTSKPLAEEIITWAKKSESGELESLLSEHSERIKSTTGIENQKKSKDLEDFFTHFEKHSEFMNWKSPGGNLRPISKLEMYTFLRKEESYIRSLKIRKNKLIKNKDLILKSLISLFDEAIFVQQVSSSEVERYNARKTSNLEFITNESCLLKEDFIKSRRFIKIINDYEITILQNKFKKYSWLNDLLKTNKEKMDVLFFEDSISYYPIVFKSKEDAESAKSYLLSLIEDDLSKVELYLDSDDTANSVIN